MGENQGTREAPGNEEDPGDGGVPGNGGAPGIPERAGGPSPAVPLSSETGPLLVRVALGPHAVGRFLLGLAVSLPVRVEFVLQVPVRHLEALHLHAIVSVRAVQVRHRHGGTAAMPRPAQGPQASSGTPDPGRPAPSGIPDLGLQTPSGIPDPGPSGPLTGPGRAATPDAPHSLPVLYQQRADPAPKP